MNETKINIETQSRCCESCLLAAVSGGSSSIHRRCVCVLWHWQNVAVAAAMHASSVTQNLVARYFEDISLKDADGCLLIKSTKTFEVVTASVLYV